MRRIPVLVAAAVLLLVAIGTLAVLSSLFPDTSPEADTVNVVPDTTSPPDTVALVPEPTEPSTPVTVGPATTAPAIPVDPEAEAPPAADAVDPEAAAPPAPDAVDPEAEAPPAPDAVDPEAAAPPAPDAVDPGAEAPPVPDAVDPGAEAPPVPDAPDPETAPPPAEAPEPEAPPAPDPEPTPPPAEAPGPETTPPPPTVDPVPTPPAPVVPPSPDPSPYPAGWLSFLVPMTEYTGSLHPTQADQLIQDVSIVDGSGNPSVMSDRNGYNGYTLDTFRIQTREGPRAAGAPITLNNGYIEVEPLAGAGDHSDGVQFYGGNGATITNTKILAGGGGATGIFAADSSHGTITLDGDYFGALPGASSPGFLVRINSDGADAVRVRNTVFECGTADNADIAIDPNLIVEWTNVHCTDGRVINKP